VKNFLSFRTSQRNVKLLEEMKLHKQ